MPLKFFKVEGYNYFEKEVKPHSKSSSKVYLPVELHGKKIAIIVLEE